MLFRGYRAGRRLYGHAELTCLAFPSGNRPGAYVRRDPTEIAHWYGRIRDEPDFREKVLIQLVLALGRRDDRLGRSLWHVIREWSRGAWCHFLARPGIEPQAVAHFLRFRRKGGWIDQLYAYRGLPPRNKVKR